MPTYEYECLKCGEIFDAFQKMSDKPLTECVKCNGSVRKLISAGSGLIFKGSGFYITDYKKKTSSNENNSCPAKESGACSQDSCPKADKSSV